jgi:hemolysin D
MTGAAGTLRRHWDVLTASWAEENARRNANKHVQESHAFLPAALEVLETPPNPIGLWLIWGMLGFVAAAIAWACIGSLDVVVSAQETAAWSAQSKRPMDSGSRQAKC